MRIMKTLVTDRTQADVNYAESLYKKLWSDFTEQEKADFNAGLKGSYKAFDLNRVGTALVSVRDRLRTHGIDVPAEVRTDYEANEVITSAAMTDYIKSVNAVYAAVQTATPEPPENMENLTWEGANNIERAIIAVDDVLESREIGWIYADAELYAGDMEEIT